MSPRLDAELVRRGLARSRAQAAQLVKDGSVRLGGVTVLRVSTPVPDDAVLEVVAAAAPLDAPLEPAAAELEEVEDEELSAALARAAPPPSDRDRR